MLSSWSSFENNTNNAWLQNFSNAKQNNDNKTNTYRVRAVRDFKKMSDVSSSAANIFFKSIR